MDLVLAGKTAVIEATERDFEDRLHVAVDDDPGRSNASSSRRRAARRQVPVPPPPRPADHEQGPGHQDQTEAFPLLFHVDPVLRERWPEVQVA
jgi:hypothetical protein